MKTITDQHRKLGLYLAARGSATLRARLQITDKDQELLDAWQNLGITPEILASVRDRLNRNPDPAAADEPDECPDPPCPYYVASMIRAIA